jgi:hypothetical protein
MVWIFALAAFVAASVYGAHRLLSGVDASRPSGPVGPLPRALVYAAAVVVGSHATAAALEIDRATSGRLGFSSDDQATAVVQVLATHATDIAWQAGLLLAAAALVAAIASGEPRQAR